jgi:hypothetical protein
MYEVWVLRSGEWILVGQYTTSRHASIIAGDYRSCGVKAKVVKEV